MAWPADNVYGVLPKNGWMVASIVIMLIHQIIAYALCEPFPQLDCWHMPCCCCSQLYLPPFLRDCKAAP